MRRTRKTTRPDARVRWRRATGWIAGAALMLGTLAAGLTAPAASADDPTTLTVPMDGSGVDTLNPFLSYYNGALDAFGLIYPTLNSLGKDGVPGPYLAESWTTSDDGLTWTFKIQDGLKWTDGEPITSEDVAFTFNLIMTNDAAATANGSLVANFKSVEAPDPTTLVITTKQPQSNMLYISIPVSGIPIVPKHLWESHVADIGDFKNDQYPIVGYGPWILQTYKTDQYQKFSVNKDFKLGDAGPAHFDNLIVKVFKNSDAQVAALKSGELAQAGVNAKQFNTLKSDSSLVPVRTVGNGWFGIEINSDARTRSGRKIGTGNPILGDPKVREAMHWAIDKDKLVETVQGGQAVVGAGYLPPAWPQWWWVPGDDQKVSFDLDKANSILDDAGYTKGSDGVRVDPKTGKKLAFRLGIHSDDTGDAQVAPFLKGWMKDIGIALTIESMSFSQLNNNLSAGDWDILMDAWTTGPDPTYLLSIQTCATLPNDKGENGNTDSFFCDPEYDKLFNQQVAEMDPDKRVALVAQMQDILYQANNNIMIYYANGLSVTRKDMVSDLTFGTPDAEGNYPAQASFWNYLDAKPPAADDTTSSDSSSAWLWGVGALIVLAGVGGTILLRRRSRSETRE